MKCLILAAGRGSRLSGLSPSKPLCRVKGRALVEWAILAARRAGIADFVVVTGFAAEDVERHLETFARTNGIAISFVANNEWEKENGLSVYKAREQLGEKFVLLMSDHIFDPAILSRLILEPLRPDELLLAVDFRVQNHPTAALDDVTKVQVENGKIAGIGKNIKVYNAFDTGIFVCPPGIFRALEKSQKKGDFSLTGGIRELIGAGKARAVDIGAAFWIDVDDQEALRRAEDLLAVND